MLNRQLRLLSGVLLIVIVTSATYAQPADGEAPPIITGTTFTISRYTATGFQASEPFDPATEVARENDRITITVAFQDGDLVETDDDPNDPNVTRGDEEFFTRKQSYWGWSFGMFGEFSGGRWYWSEFYDAPAPPPIQDDSPIFQAPNGLSLDPLPADTGTFLFSFRVPEFVGASQERLRNPALIPYDLVWAVRIELANVEDPGQEDPVSRTYFDLFAIENPVLRAPNPPPFADAGSDQLVELDDNTNQVTVTLDGSRTFDGSNVGFDPLDPDIYEKDNLQFTWEFVSGPGPREEPVDNGDNNPATAEVTLTVPSLTVPYVFRLTVVDQINPLPSSDTMNVWVRTDLPTNSAPTAVATAPAEAVPVGGTITLDASGSSDPDGDSLDFLWRQTNEVGGPLSSDQISTGFQPMAGLDEAVSSWRATTEGTFYFLVLVTDEPEERDAALVNAELSDTAMVSVVVSAAADGDSASLQNDAQQALEQTSPVLPGLCGAGLAPAAILPALMLLMRRRYR